MVLAGTVGVLDGHGPGGVGHGGSCGFFPEGARVWRRTSFWLTARGFCLNVGSGVRGELGSRSVAGCSAGGCAGAVGALGSADERVDGLEADVPGVGVVGYGDEGVEVVAGNDVGDLVAVAGKRGAQGRGRLEMAGLSVAARQGVVGDLPEHVLGELVDRK